MAREDLYKTARQSAKLFKLVQENQELESWVSKKIKELMGEEETSFCQFIMTSIESHDSAQELFGKLQDVLDEDAHSFVTKLFQVIIYETEKIATGT
jgi:RNA-binding protein 25